MLYRKYRPEKWSEVIGQNPIVEVLKAAVANKSIAHAYLFSGSRGTGKTSVARIFAQAVGCTPTDLYEMDAASNRRIDDVREIREAVTTLPFESPYKVYIIDEVHMLTTEAFNALLKTLEEPPEHMIFILATTDLHRVPETIISRCQTFVFKKPAREELMKHLTSVAKKEEYILEKDAADLITTLGDGSFRDALGVLQKVITVSPPAGRAGKDNTLTRDEVARVTGAPKTELVHTIARAMIESKTDEALTVVVQALDENIDMKVLARLLMHTLRQAMLILFAPDIRAELKRELSVEEYEFAESLGKGERAKRLPALLKELLTVYTLIENSPEPALPLELAIIRAGENK